MRGGPGQGRDRQQERVSLGSGRRGYPSSKWPSHLLRGRYLSLSVSVSTPLPLAALFFSMSQ